MAAQATLAEERIARRVIAFGKLRVDLPLFAREMLKIRPKDVLAAPIVPLIYNRTQLAIHRAAEDQISRTGRVRVMVGKGRKTTVSTYVASRGFHRTIFNRGYSAYIMAQAQETADELFDMVKRFHEHMPARPVTSLDNAKELEFSKLDSRIAVGTAGTKEKGRGTTPQFLQWSEAAHSPNAHTHYAGIVQAVPDVPGSEIWVETTGAGPSGAYYERWQDAEAGRGDYIATFAPWFWTEEYTRDVSNGFELDEEEERYQSLYGLTLGQMAWRRAKMIELKDPKVFMIEYPANATEMFAATGKDSFIDPELVLAARKRTLEGIGPLVVGVDPGGRGLNGRFSVAWRRGRKVLAVESRSGIGTNAAIAWLKDIIDQHRPIKMFMDVGGGGDRIYDVMTAWGEPYSSTIVLVNFGDPAHVDQTVTKDGTKRGGPLNRRAQMYERGRDWLEQVGGADLPDSDSLQTDACAAGATYRTTDSKLVIESKEHLKERGIRSPDEWDATILTFAEPVADRRPRPPPRVLAQQAGGGAGQGWMGL
jgi:hypothetical protein